MSVPPEELTAALVAGDQRRFAELLGDAEVALLFAAPATPLVLTDESGQRAVAAFTSPATARRWDRADRVGVVAGGRLAELAAEQRVDVVLIDPAGPAPVSVSPAQLQALLDGIVTDSAGESRLVGTLHARSASDDRAAQVRAALADRPAQPLDLYLFERRVGDGWVTTLGAFGPGVAVAALAHALSTKDLDGVLDVVELTDDVRDSLATQLPASRL